MKNKFCNVSLFQFFCNSQEARIKYKPEKQATVLKSAARFK